MCLGIKTDCEKNGNMYYNGHCYIAHQYKDRVKISYSDAEQTCKTLGGKLAEWKDLETQLEVSNMYKGASQCILGGVIDVSLIVKPCVKNSMGLNSKIVMTSSEQKWLILSQFKNNHNP